MKSGEGSEAQGLPTQQAVVPGPRQNGCLFLRFQNSV